LHLVVGGRSSFFGSVSPLFPIHKLPASTPTDGEFWGYRWHLRVHAGIFVALLAAVVLVLTQADVAGLRDRARDRASAPRAQA
jgi:hypothetical protein